MTARPRVAAATLLRGAKPVAGSAGGAMPWSRHLLSAEQWAAFAEQLRGDPLGFAGLWGDGGFVHALMLDGPDAPLLASVAVERNRVLALSPARPAASVPERVLRELWGIEAMGAIDLRPWLDHGGWGVTAPLSERPGPAAWPPEPPEFGWSEADAAAGAMQAGIGPVQALLDGPVQLRVTLRGERVRRIEPLLGFAHRGVAGALRGCTVDRAARLAGRIDARAVVAHQAAFAAAVEDACGRPADGGVRALRQAMLATERVAVGLHVLGRIASAAADAGAGAAVRAARGSLLPAVAAAFGHRLMRDAILPGGGAAPPDGNGLALLSERLGGVDALLPRLNGLPDAGERLAALRRDLALARRGLGAPAAGPEAAAARPPGGTIEGLGSARSAQGTVWHWVRLEHGVVGAFHAVDPNLTRLDALCRAAEGEPMHRLALLCAASGVSPFGADG